MGSEKNYSSIILGNHRAKVDWNRKEYLWSDENNESLIRLKGNDSNQNSRLAVQILSEDCQVLSITQEWHGIGNWMTVVGRNLISQERYL